MCTWYFKIQLWQQKHIEPYVGKHLCTVTLLPMSTRSNDGFVYKAMETGKRQFSFAGVSFPLASKWRDTYVCAPFI